MIEWNETHVAIRDAVRRFVETEIKPHHKELEHGDMLPYPILRKLFEAFGMRDMAELRFQRMIASAKKACRSRTRCSCRTSQKTSWWSRSCDGSCNASDPCD